MAAALCASACVCIGFGAGAGASAVGKSDTVVTTGCLKAADEMDEPVSKTHDASGAPYFVLTDTQLAPASPNASAPASAEAAKAAGIQPGALYRVIGLSSRMLRARANTQVEVIGKVEPGKAAALGGPTPETTLDSATAIDSLPAINAKSIRTLSPRCAEDERK
jgi:hypothetical protein